MNALPQEVVIPIKVCKKKLGSRTYFMHLKIITVNATVETACESVQHGQTPEAKS